MATSVLSTPVAASVLIEEYVMSLVVGYFDESEDPEELDGATYTVAGFVASNRLSSVIEMRWRDLLDKYKIEYFKASELSAGMGQFKQYRDDPELKKWAPFSEREIAIFGEIKAAFTDVIVKVGADIRIVGATVILPDYEQLAIDEPDTVKHLSHPYYECAQTVLMEAGLQIHKENRDYHEPRGHVSLRPMFDSHQNYESKLKGIFGEFCAKNPLASRYMMEPLYESDKAYLSLQVADNIAFEIRKYAVSTLRNGRPMRKSLERIYPFFWRVFKLDYAGLKLCAEANARDFNPVAPLSYTLDDIT